MSRGRRPYAPLSVEDDGAQRSSAKSRKERRPSYAWLEEQPACSSLFQQLPTVFAPCSGNAFRAAFEDLEESYKDLESRHSILLDTLRQDKESHSTDAAVALATITDLERRLHDASAQGTALQQELSGSQQQTAATVSELEKLKEKLASAQADAATAQDSLQTAESETEQALNELKEEREGHQETHEQLAATLAENARLLAALSEAEQAGKLAEEQLQKSEEKIDQQARELSKKAADAAQAEERFSEAEAQLKAEVAGAEENASKLVLELEAAKAAVSETEKALQHAKAEISQLTLNLSAQATQSSQTHDKLRQEFEADHSRLRSEIESKERAAASLSIQLADAKAEVATLAAQLAQSKQNNARLRQETEAQCTRLSSELESKEKLAAGTSLKLRDAKAELSQLTSYSATQVAHRQENARMRQEIEAECARLSSELESKSQAAASLAVQLEESKAEAQELAANLKAAEANLADAEEQVADMYSQVQAARAELASAKRDAGATEEMLKTAQEEASCLVEELEAAHEEGFRLADLLQAAEARLATLDAKSPVNGGHATSSSAPESRPGSECLHDLSSSPVKGQGSLWDSAAEISRPDHVSKSLSSTTPNGSALPEEFSSREEWQKLWEEGSAAGWLATPQEIEKREVLGRGSFGVTYIGCLRGQEAAIKCVRVEQESHYRTFVREVGALARVRHPNVMRLLGAVLQPPHVCWLVCEYLPGGTLAEWLYGKGGSGAPRRTMNEKLAMAVGIAQGMLALELTQPPIIHRDLKPSNVMLSADAVPKVSDFGLCREHLEDEAYTYTGETGSYTYMSPEMMRGDIYGPSTDVYSFAILMTEILKQRPPFEEFYITPMQTAEGVAYNDLRPSLPGSLPGGLKPLLEACWDGEPENRPNFGVIAEHLADISAKLPPPRRSFFS